VATIQARNFAMRQSRPDDQSVPWDANRSARGAEGHRGVPPALFAIETAAGCERGVNLSDRPFGGAAAGDFHVRIFNASASAIIELTERQIERAAKE